MQFTFRLFVEKECIILIGAITELPSLTKDIIGNTID